MIIEMAVCYYLVFAICFVSAIYLLFMNSKSMLQRLAFFLCFSVYSKPELLEDLMWN